MQLNNLAINMMIVISIFHVMKFVMATFSIIIFPNYSEDQGGKNIYQSDDQGKVFNAHFQYCIYRSHQSDMFPTVI